MKQILAKRSQLVNLKKKVCVTKEYMVPHIQDTIMGQLTTQAINKTSLWSEYSWIMTKSMCHRLYFFPWIDQYVIKELLIFLSSVNHYVFISWYLLNLLVLFKNMIDDGELHAFHRRSAHQMIMYLMVISYSSPRNNCCQKVQ